MQPLAKTDPTRRPPVRTAGRPREFDTEAVLEAALTFFWQKGIRATTRQLEAVLGMSQSSIYNAFGSKQGLLDRALDRYENQADRALIAPLLNRDDGLAAIEAFFLALRDWIVRQDRRGCMLINLMAETGATDAMIARRAERYRDRVRTALIGALQRAAAAGEIADDRVQERADILICLLLGFNVATRGGASAAELERLLDSVLGQCQRWRQRHID